MNRGWRVGGGCCGHGCVEGVVTTRSADVVEILESEEKELYSETSQLKGKAVTSCTIANISPALTEVAQ